MSPGGPRPCNAYAAFAPFGALWGVWGASIPAILDAAGVSEGQLGTALLFIGAGALPAMGVVGRGGGRSIGVSGIVKGPY